MKAIANLLSVTIFFLSTSAPAQPACSEFEAAIDQSLKVIARQKSLPGGDSNLARETSRQLEIANQLQLITLNLTLMNQHKCPALQTPISSNAYSDAARKCFLAETKGDKGANASTVCDVNTWQKNERHRLPP
jgi:hypothetical protein